MTDPFLVATARRLMLLGAAVALVLSTTASSSPAQEADKKLQLLFSDRPDGSEQQRFCEVKLECKRGSYGV